MYTMEYLIDYLLVFSMHFFSGAALLISFPPLLLSYGEDKAPNRDLTTQHVFSASMLEFSLVSETLDCPEEL